MCVILYNTCETGHIESSVLLSLSASCCLLYFRQGKHPYERVNTPYQVYSWLSPVLDHTLDAIRAEDGMYSVRDENDSFKWSLYAAVML